MFKHNSLRNPRIPAVLLAAALSASALAGCNSDTEAAPKHTISAAEQARINIDRNAELKQLEELDISNTFNVNDTDMSFADKTKAIYGSVKNYVEYAKAHNLPLNYFIFYPESDYGSTCSIDLNDNGDIKISSTNWFDGNEDTTFLTISPSGTNFFVDRAEDSHGMEHGYIDDAQLSTLVMGVSVLQINIQQQVGCGGDFLANNLFGEIIPTTVSTSENIKP